MRRLRSPFIALLALALSAGAVFASRALPQAASTGLANAAVASGQAVPVRSQDDQEQAGGTQRAPDQDTGNDQDADENASAEHPDNHGKAVSEAAHKTDAEIAALGLGAFDNHGAYVSSVAKTNSGQTTSATHRAGHGKPDDTGKPD